MMRKFFLAAAALAALASTAAQAAPTLGAPNCQLRIGASTTNWIIRGYDPFGNSAPSGTFELTFYNDGDQECVFFPVFSTDDSFGLQKANGHRVPYVLMDMFGGYDATPTSGRTIRPISRRSVVVAPHGQQFVQYGFAVSEDAISGNGLFDQRVAVEAQGTDGLPLAARQLDVGIDVLPSATLGLSGAFQLSGGQATVDLGELTEGLAPVPLQLRVQSTGRYELTLESRNNGRLALQNTEWTVPYQLLVGGQQVQLSSGRGLYRGVTDQTTQRASLPLQFRVGDPSGHRAGIYSDVISITIAPL